MSNPDDLASRLDFESWKGFNREDHELFVDGFFIPEDLLDGWRLARSQTTPERGDTSTKLTVWTDEDNERVLTVESYESPSRQAAHDTAITVLNDFQSPQLQRLESDEVGDVSFGEGTRFWMLFARANVVVLLRNAGDTVVPTENAAASVDRWIAEQNEPGGHEIVPRIDLLRVDRVDRVEGETEQWPLTYAVTDPLQRPVMIKLFTSGGHITRRDEQLLLVPTRRTPVTITLVAINPNRGVATRSETFDQS